MLTTDRHSPVLYYLNMIINDPDKRKELDNVPDIDENGEPINKIDNDDVADQANEAPPVSEIEVIAEDSKFQNTPQDLKDKTSQD